MTTPATTAHSISSETLSWFSHLPSDLRASIDIEYASSPEYLVRRTTAPEEHPRPVYECARIAGGRFNPHRGELPELEGGWEPCAVREWPSERIAER